MDQANPFLLTDDPGGLTDDPDGGYHVIVCPVTAIGSPRRNRNRNFGTEVALDRSFRNFGRNAVGPTEICRVGSLAMVSEVLMVWALAIPWVHRSESEEESVQRLTNSHNSCPARPHLP